TESAPSAILRRASRIEAASPTATRVRAAVPGAAGASRVSISSGSCPFENARRKSSSARAAASAPWKSLVLRGARSPFPSLAVAAERELDELGLPAGLHVGREGDRVVSLGERVEELVKRDRLAGGPALLEVVALENSSDRDPRGEPDESFGAQRREPGAVELDDRLVRIEDAESLAGIGRGIGLDLGARELRPGRLAPECVPHHPAEAATDAAAGGPGFSEGLRLRRLGLLAARLE